MRGRHLVLGLGLGLALSLGNLAARAAPAAPDHVVQARQVHMVADLSGAKLTGGERAGTGTAELVVDVFWNFITWKVNTEKLSDAQAVQIRKASGEPVLTLGEKMAGMQKGMSEELLTQLAARPSDYVLTVTSKKSPNGAVQGALVLR